MIFKTESGSKYEWDRFGKRIRRISGVRPPTASIGADGEWHAYDKAIIELGQRAFVHWRGGRGLVTSRVTELGDA